MKAVPRRPRDPREITHDASDLWFNALHGDAAEVANVIRSVPDGAVNHRGVRQWTCLFAAATRGHVEVARLLLEHGADPELEMEQGWRALMTAAQQGFAPIVQLLLKLAIAHLLEDVSVSRLIDFERFTAMGADNFMHESLAFD
jgi:ankyrin repeat protein